MLGDIGVNPNDLNFRQGFLWLIFLLQLFVLLKDVIKSIREKKKNKNGGTYVTKAEFQQGVADLQLQIREALNSMLVSRAMESDMMRAELQRASSQEEIRLSKDYMVLLISDDDDYRYTIRRIIDGYCGFKDTSSVREAIDLIKNRKFTPDCVILDMRLGDDFSEQTMADFRKTWHGPLCAITANEDPALFTKALNAGADSFLIKRKHDFSADTILRRVRDAIVRHHQKIQ
jgi:CheY-like chemotaxis protein